MRHRCRAALVRKRTSAVDAERSAEKRRIRMIESVPFLLDIWLPLLIQIRIRNDRRLTVHLVDPVLMLHQEMKTQRAHFLRKHRSSSDGEKMIVSPVPVFSPVTGSERPL